MTSIISSRVEAMITTSSLNEKQKPLVLEFFKSLRGSEQNKLYMLLAENPNNLQTYADFVEELVNRKNENLSLEEIEKMIDQKLVEVSE